MTIWRYMDFPKFLSMLSSSALWFAKAASFEDDPWEGFGTALRAEAVEVGPNVIAAQDGDGPTRKMPLSEVLAGLSQRSADIVENAREHLYVNSWYMDESESMAMWEIYGSQGRGLAIKATVERYQSAVTFAVDSTHYAFGKVTYQEHIETAPEVKLDFTTKIPLQGPGLRREVLPLGLHKRWCFRHENEWRAVLYQDPRPDNGVSVAVDLELLIDTVYLGPRARQSMVGVVSDTMSKFGLHKLVERSALLASPIRKKLTTAASTISD